MKCNVCNNDNRVTYFFKDEEICGDCLDEEIQKDRKEFITKFIERTRKKIEGIYVP